MSWRCRLGLHAWANARYRIGPCTREGCSAYVGVRELDKVWVHYSGRRPLGEPPLGKPSPVPMPEPSPLPHVGPGGELDSPSKGPPRPEDTDPRLSWLLEDWDDTERLAEVARLEAFYARLVHHGNVATDPETGETHHTGCWRA